MLQEALTNAEAASSPAVRNEVHKALSDVASMSGDHKEAYEHLKRHTEVRGQMLSQESTKKVASVEYLHKIELQQREQVTTDRILHNVLPVVIAGRLKAGETQIADTVPEATVLFADIVGFTPLIASVSADDLVRILAQVFGRFDEICSKHGVEKIKTIGDSYMAAAGAPEESEDHALRCGKAALEMVEDFSVDTSEFSSEMPDLVLQFRIGIHSGPVVAGVIGDQRIAYDLWGDTVNIASRMESTGESSKIQVSEAFRLVIPNDVRDLAFRERGEVEIKGKGKMKTFWLS